MTYGDNFLLIVGLLYIGAAITYFLDGKSAMCLVMFAYAIANYGLILASK